MEIEIIKEFCNQSKIKWSSHCLERMQERDISRADVKNCLEHGEIIEDYPEDFPYPSCLVFVYSINNKVIHVVNYKGCIIVIKNVPCEECVQCGEKFYTDAVAERLEIAVNLAKKLMQEVSVIDYSKVA